MSEKGDAKQQKRIIAPYVIDLNFHLLYPKTTNSSTHLSIFKVFKKYLDNETLMSVAYKPEVKEVICFRDNKNGKHYFRKSNAKWKTILELFKKKERLGFYTEKIGGEFGQRPDYLGSFLRKTWNLYIINKETNKNVLVKIVCFFRPIANKRPSEFNLMGYIIMRAE